MNVLWKLFCDWVKRTDEEYIQVNQDAAFINIDVAGKGWIGDDAGGVYFEFDDLNDGISQLEIACNDLHYSFLQESGNETAK